MPLGRGEFEPFKCFGLVEGGPVPQLVKCTNHELCLGMALVRSSGPPLQDPGEILIRLQRQVALLVQEIAVGILCLGISSLSRLQEKLLCTLAIPSVEAFRQGLE